jgi:hypothetical protein
VTGQQAKKLSRTNEEQRRIRLPVLRALLFEHASLVAQRMGVKDIVVQLASKYALDEMTLQKVLKYNSLQQDEPNRSRGGPPQN